MRAKERSSVDGCEKVWLNDDVLEALRDSGHSGPDSAVRALLAEVERLREALRYFADKNPTSTWDFASRDAFVRRAREALASSHESSGASVGNAGSPDPDDDPPPTTDTPPLPANHAERKARLRAWRKLRRYKRVRRWVERGYFG